MFYHPTGWVFLQVINNFGPKHLIVATQRAVGFWSFTNVYIYNAVCYKVEFPAFIDNSKGLLTCIQDCNMSGECTTPLMSLGLIGQAAAGVRRCSLKILNVDIWSCRCHRDLSRKMRTMNARFLDFRYNFQTSLYWHGLLPHYCTTE